MKSLFKREFKDVNIVRCLNEVESECEWVLRGEGYATEKIDGACCLILDGKIYSVLVKVVSEKGQFAPKVEAGENYAAILKSDGS